MRSHRILGLITPLWLVCLGCPPPPDFSSKSSSSGQSTQQQQPSTTDASTKPLFPQLPEPGPPPFPAPRSVEAHEMLSEGSCWEMLSASRHKIWTSLDQRGAYRLLDSGFEATQPRGIIPPPPDHHFVGEPDKTQRNLFISEKYIATVQNDQLAVFDRTTGGTRYLDLSVERTYGRSTVLWLDGTTLWVVQTHVEPKEVPLAIRPSHWNYDRDKPALTRILGLELAGSTPLSARVTTYLEGIGRTMSGRQGQLSLLLRTQLGRVDARFAEDFLVGSDSKSRAQAVQKAIDHNTIQLEALRAQDLMPMYVSRYADANGEQVASDTLLECASVYRLYGTGSVLTSVVRLPSLSSGSSATPQAELGFRNAGSVLETSSGLILDYVWQQHETKRALFGLSRTGQVSVIKTNDLLNGTWSMRASFGQVMIVDKVAPGGGRNGMRAHKIGWDAARIQLEGRSIGFSVPESSGPIPQRYGILYGTLRFPGQIAILRDHPDYKLQAVTMPYFDWSQYWTFYAPTPTGLFAVGGERRDGQYQHMIRRYSTLTPGNIEPDEQLVLSSSLGADTSESFGWMTYDESRKLLAIPYQGRSCTDRPCARGVWLLQLDDQEALASLSQVALAPGQDERLEGSANDDQGWRTYSSLQFFGGQLFVRTLERIEQVDPSSGRVVASFATRP